MKLRIARKIKKLFIEAVAEQERIRAFNCEVGPEGAAMRDCIAKVLPSIPPLEPKYQGWWPKGKIKSHLDIKNRPFHNTTQQLRAFYRLPHPERMDYWIASRIERGAREREEMLRTDPWGLAKRDIERWPSLMAALPLLDNDNPEPELSQEAV